MFPITAKDWPEWVFTSEIEQAIQVWTRLSFLAGLGVQKVWWYSNVVSETASDHTWTEFYGYGVTEDLMVSRMSAGCGECMLVDPFDPTVGAPVLYSTRYKKPSFCALKRWNHYLGRYRCAEVLPRFDGLDAAGGHVNQGFYAVVFRIADDTADHPFALVTWTDAQVLSRCADLGIGAGSPFPLAGCEAERGLVFVSAVGAAGPQPKVVQTIPREVAGTEPLIVNPCLDDGDVETPPAAAGDPGYAAGRVWQFGPDRSLVYRELLSGVWGTRVGIHASHLPMLILLPAGRLVTSEPTGAVVEEVYVLDSGALVAGAC
ncbi:hypothetical protein L6R50_18100 [Myxococcota bacterium]|nr:hypothetical protein [Myxococcota bacterium]